MSTAADRARRAYQRKTQLAGAVPCLHIAIRVTDRGTVNSAKEFHVIFDVRRGTYIYHFGCQMTESLRAEFHDQFSGTSRLVQTPRSAVHAESALERARGALEPPCKEAPPWACSEEFARWCFAQDETSDPQSGSLSALGLGAIGGASAGVVSGFAAASVPIVTGVGATGLVVASLPVAAILSIAAGGAALGVALGVTASKVITDWIADEKEMTSELIPIGIYNKSEEDILALIQNVDTQIIHPALDDALQGVRAQAGVGSLTSTIGSMKFGELNPPTLEDCYARFHLTVQGCSRNSCEVSRGDVLIFDGWTLIKFTERPERCIQTVDDNDEDRACCICMDNVANIMLDPCRHEFCSVCSVNLTRCPLCREVVARELLPVEM
eukprot:TRINITY_DN14317_c1_g1_i1.p1 TRINITY_DN14317_c1_g1~~TRINITY_DN14317_c1_g1_i1.p1  ORF type:complete len:382 (+),score=65.34 TRINITY_DN14317_c1_g1_i1:65-1210(+)